jgi:hypothetical protein
MDGVGPVEDFRLQAVLRVSQHTQAAKALQSQPPIENPMKVQTLTLAAAKTTQQLRRWLHQHAHS